MKYLNLLLLTFFLAVASLAQGRTELQNTPSGWQMTVDGEPFYVKGFTWSHTPVGMKYDYNLFAEEEPVIKAALKRDLTLIRDAGGNTLRHIYPPVWMKYMHETYGMHFIANDYCGRYGLTIDGKFIANTDYSDPKTREFIKQTWRDLVTKNKDVPGLLAYALGNENNYGLEWISAAVENLPEGERQTAKARHLYSLFNEIALEVKALDPDHPVGIVNGDLQYLDLIAELCPDIDFLGVNAYRGETFSDLFTKVKATLNKPVILMETGCDAYHAVKEKEEQTSQALMVHDNWIDLYRNTLMNGGSGNCLGGLHFQWADEWWKHGQEYGLNDHDTTGSWHHAEYTHDAAAKQNMNEEWFGVCAISDRALNGVHLIRPRASYFALKDLWKQNPYTIGTKKLQALTFNAPAATQQANAATKEFESQLSSAETPYHQSPNAKLPAPIYLEGNTEAFWAASGVMPEKSFLTVNPNSTENPHSGETCLEFRYTSGGDWSGLQFQHPAGDWENNSPGGYNLNGATTLKLWARGHQGGEKLALSMGGGLTGLYPNTCQADLGTIELTTKWKQFTFPLEGKDLRRIKNPLTIVLSGTGFPYRAYLDDIVFE
ncbi:MAG: glycoside hydrolase family 2 TIM barrel-domain containing protein [Roseibacillus sp.]